MKILKYKKLSSGRYKLELEGSQAVELYEETILKFELLLKKKVDNLKMVEILEYDKEWDVYYVGLKALKSRFKSTQELRDYLIKKEYSYDLVDIVIEKLLKQGYLNDELFAKSYINNQMITSSRGPIKISNELFSKGIDQSIVSKEILVFTDELQIEKINKIIRISLKSNRSRGGSVLKNKIINDLIVSGYDLSIINKVISDYEFDSNEEIAKKEYEKLYRKYSRKYSGRELEYKIKEKLYQKGLKYEKD